MNPFRRLAEEVRAGRSAALVTLAEIRGSSPREAGARMVVTEAGFSGTIGGGTLEWQALALAQNLMVKNPQGAGIIRDFSLGPDLGQCCGGRVTVMIEAFGKADLDWLSPLAEAEAGGVLATEARADARGVFVRKRVENCSETSRNCSLRSGFCGEIFGENPLPLLLFGAGHVGRALALVLAPLPFRTRWIDTRAEAFPAHHPGNVVPVVAADPTGEIRAAPEGTIALIMTHSHALDLDLTATALGNPGIAFTGVIGSATKRARFVSRLRQMGIAEAAIAKLVCPVGLPGLGKEPAVIAAGIAVGLLEIRAKRQQGLASTTSRASYL